MSERFHCVPGSNTWHSSSDCPLYPRRDYWSHRVLPVGGELCAQCRLLQRNARASWRERSEHLFSAPVVGAAGTSTDTPRPLPGA